MRQSWKSLYRLIGGLILACLPLAAPAAGGLAPAVGLAAEARQAAAAGGPLIVLYSRADCAFCRAVKRDFLGPLAADPRYAGRVVIREIGQDSDAPLADFAGRPTSHAAFAASERIRLVPVVAFYGPDGRQLHPPIVGARLPDFYQSYLENAIEQSMQALRQR
ncbi:thioredoxin family protein [Azonexus fungiphilus]|uniref:thioredoxin family protein n=1 Tax=Azonexus fungiphilus TaxID=146940 RepID=UPI001474FF66|nr:thioredoxin family protein [Azonexus fungiphilus]